MRTNRVIESLNRRVIIGREFVRMCMTGGMHVRVACALRAYVVVVRGRDL